MTKKLEEITCVMCNGSGQTSEYSIDGMDFLGPKECPTCNGTGILRMDKRGRCTNVKGQYMGHIPR